MRRAALVIVIFALGIAAGVGAVLTTTAWPPSVDPVSISMPRFTAADEPQATRKAAQAMRHHDAAALVHALGVVMADFKTALDDVSTIDEVVFVGAAQVDNETVAAYAISGADSNGAPASVGITFGVRNGVIMHVR